LAASVAVTTRFFVFTRPEIERVQFLPEQIEPLDDGAAVEI
jgi:hypothetical protein